MKNTEFDLLIIGGGITGAGIALDAVTRGLKVSLIEMGDFAHGTSSRSTKLVHGGLRYLKQFEINEVATLGKERAIVYENGPHVTTPVLMLLPFFKGGTFSHFSTSIGLKIYDMLARVKKSERRTMISKTDVLNKVPFIKKEGLRGGGLYVEYRTDDARLTLEVIKEAATFGAQIANYVKAIDFNYVNDRITGVRAKDLLTNQTFDINAKYIVNAAGPWVDELRMIDHSVNTKNLQLSKGAHLVFNQADLPLKQAVYFDTPDKRMMFAIPKDNKTYVGTTDTFFEGDPIDLMITKDDRDYIINAINFIFPNLNINESLIESSWAGVRPLIYEKNKDPSEISRKDEIWKSPTGLLTIAGGKLTGYRKMAQTVVDQVVASLKTSNKIIYSASKTFDLPISGGHIGGSKNLDSFIKINSEILIKLGLTKIESIKLVKIYGSNIHLLHKYIQNNSTDLPTNLYAQLMYAIDYEMVITPIDFFMRRNADILFNIEQVILYKAEVLNLMQDVFKWSDALKESYRKSLNNEILIATMPRNHY